MEYISARKNTTFLENSHVFGDHQDDRNTPVHQEYSSTPGELQYTRNIPVHQ